MSTTRKKSEYSDKYPSITHNGLYKNSIFSPSRGYHPLRQPDKIRIQIRGVTVSAM